MSNVEVEVDRMVEKEKNDNGSKEAIGKFGDVFLFENEYAKGDFKGEKYYTLSKKDFNGQWRKFFLSENEYKEIFED